MRLAAPTPPRQAHPARPARSNPPALLGLALLTLCLALPSHAQDSKAANREREALRRAQAALQQAQQQRDALQTEKTTLEQARSKAEAEAGSQRKALAQAQAALKALQVQLSQWQADQTAQAADRARADEAARAEAAAALAQREQGWRSQLEQAQRLGEERRLANTTLVAQLQARSQALDDAQRRVAALHALGLDLLNRWQGLGPLDRALLNEPVLGVAAVRRASQAEALRSQMDALLQPGGGLPAALNTAPSTAPSAQ